MQMRKPLSALRRNRVVIARPFRWNPWLGAAIVCLFAGVLPAIPPELSPSPTPTPVATPVREAEPKPKPMVERRAPAGVLYLLEDTSVVINNGLQGFVAGTEIRLLKANGDLLQVAAGDCQFTVKKAQVTDNLDIAAAVRKRAAAIEAANEASQRLQEAALIKQQHDEIEFLRTHPLATPTPTPTPKK